MGMGMLPFAIHAAVAATAGYLNPIPQPGEPGYTPTPQHHMRVTYENDSASGRDRNYTHGTRVDYAYTMESGHAWGISLTQNIYTPEHHAPHAVPNEHPYCGYLALGGAYLYRGKQFGFGGELQVGTTGFASCAGRFQNVLHDMINMDEWEGWDDQVPAEVTMQLSLRQEWAPPALQCSLPGEWQMETRAVLREAVGSVRIGGGGGFCLRVGRNLPPTMQTASNTPVGFGEGLIRRPGYDPSAISYYVAMEAYVDYVARDISVDGGIFRHFESTCTRTPWQAEARLGGGLRYAGIDYYAGLLLLSRTYKTQDENSVLGAFSVSWNW